MKTKFLLAGLVVIMIISLAFSLDTFGQGKEKQKGPPPWAPAHGYRAQTRHVYFPDYNFYFDIQKSVYIHLSGENWQVSAKLPSIFSGVDLKIALKVELDLDTDTPQNYNNDHKVKYKGKIKDKKVQPKKNPGKGKKQKN